MARKKKRTRPAAASATGGRRSAQRKPATKSIAIVVIGVAAALAMAVYLASGGGSPATTPVDASLLAAGMNDGNTRGADNASVTIIEYGDFECPTCAAFHPIVKTLLARMPDNLELVYHHYPIPVGPNSLVAAFAAEAAAEQGMYWEMHDALFDTQSQWTGRDNAIELFTSMAGQLGLDTNRFTADLEAPAVQARVFADRQQGAALGVTGTPAFFVNGQRLNTLPQSADQFEAILRSVVIR